MTTTPPLDVARAESLLVCLDFDGTLAELDPDPYAVAAHPDALRAIEQLSRMPRTQVAILTGRHLDGLRQVFPLREPVVLVGSHGAEPGPALSSADEAWLAEVEAQLREIAQRGAAGGAPGAYVEVKPFQRVLHVAPVADAGARAAMLEEALNIDAEGRPVIEGSNVVEFAALEVSKGSWLAAHKQDFAATVFAGDDTTDETALAVLGPDDVGIKVGAKPSVAKYRLPDVAAVAAWLSALAQARNQSC